MDAAGDDLAELRVPLGGSRIHMEVLGIVTARELDNLFFIDVSHAPNYDARNGHSYFRASPWVSSDLLMTTEYALTPEQRGLILEPDEIHWTFPDDYVAELRAAIYRANPVVAEKAFGPAAK